MVSVARAYWRSRLSGAISTAPAARSSKLFAQFAPPTNEIFQSGCFSSIGFSWSGHSCAITTTASAPAFHTAGTVALSASSMGLNSRP
ncbi:hypothetical protein [Chondromyces crocatus]|uniref:hypothetical protein n=1 Tax=Chondromyces crocatus TaxID=52 RepID=UPI0009EB5F3F